jgi:hypothetical protein
MARRTMRRGVRQHQDDPSGSGGAGAQPGRNFARCTRLGGAKWSRTIRAKASVRDCSAPANLRSTARVRTTDRGKGEWNALKIAGDFERSSTRSANRARGSRQHGVASRAGLRRELHCRVAVCDRTYGNHNTTKSGQRPRPSFSTEARNFLHRQQIGKRRRGEGAQGEEGDGTRDQPQSRHAKASQVEIIFFAPGNATGTAAPRLREVARRGFCGVSERRDQAEWHVLLNHGTEAQSVLDWRADASPCILIPHMCTRVVGTLCCTSVGAVANTSMTAWPSHRGRISAARKRRSAESRWNSAHVLPRRVWSTGKVNPNAR